MRFPVALLLALLPFSAKAFCFEAAENRYKVHRDLLRAIATQESGLNPRAINRNKNGSVDVGLMQINSQHFPLLAKYGVDKDWLWEPCYNVMVGAWILAKNVERHGMTWKAVGAYNSSMPSQQEKYAGQVAGRLSKILRNRSG